MFVIFCKIDFIRSFVFGVFLKWIGFLGFVCFIGLVSVFGIIICLISFCCGIGICLVFGFGIVICLGGLFWVGIGMFGFLLVGEGKCILWLFILLEIEVVLLGEWFCYIIFEIVCKKLCFEMVGFI